MSNETLKMFSRKLEISTLSFTKTFRKLMWCLFIIVSLLGDFSLSPGNHEYAGMGSLKLFLLHSKF